MKKKLLIGVLALFLTFTLFSQIKDASYFVKKAATIIKQVTPEKAKEMIDKGGIIIIDVRTTREYRKGTIPGALHIPRGLLEFKITKAVKDPNQKILIFCAKGGRGALATKTLMDMGYKNVYNLKGGIKAWKAAGYPVGK